MTRRRRSRCSGRRHERHAAVARRPPPAAVPFVRMDHDDPELLEELLGVVRTRRRAGRLHRGLARRGLRGRLRRLLRAPATPSASPRGPRRSCSRCARWASAPATRSSCRPTRSSRPPRPSAWWARRRASSTSTRPRGLITADIVAGRARRRQVRCVIPVHLYGATVDMDPILEVAGRRRHRRDRGRVPGARRPLPRPPRRHAGRRGLLQLLPDQEPRRLGRRRGRRHLATGARRARAPAALARRAPALPPPHGGHHGAPGRAAGGDPAREAAPPRRLERPAPARGGRAAPHAAGPGRRGAGAARVGRRPRLPPVRRAGPTSATRCARTSPRAASPRRCTTRCRSTAPRPTPTSAIEAGSLPVAERLAERVCSLPLFPGIDDEQIEAIGAALAEVGARRRSSVDAPRAR